MKQTTQTYFNDINTNSKQRSIVEISKTVRTEETLYVSKHYTQVFEQFPSIIIDKKQREEEKSSFINSNSNKFQMNNSNNKSATNNQQLSSSTPTSPTNKQQQQHHHHHHQRPHNHHNFTLTTGSPSLISLDGSDILSSRSSMDEFEARGGQQLNLSNSSSAAAMTNLNDMNDINLHKTKQDKHQNGLINTKLIPLKMILFCWYAAGACLLPYMTLHMMQLGLTPLEQTAIYTVLPLIQLIGQPIAGYLADRMGNYKPVLSLTLQVCIATTLMLQFMVPARKPQYLLTKPTTITEDSLDDSNPLSNTLYMVTFWMYLIIRIFHQVSVGLAYVLLDTTTLVKVKEHNSEYGRQRFWAILATGIFSPICGFIIDQISVERDFQDKIIKNYNPAFYFFEFLTLFTLMMATTMKIEISSPPKVNWKDIKELFKAANVWAFLIAVFIMGSCWGFLESFLFIYLQELKAPSYLMGLTVTIGAFVGLPFLYCSEWFINKIGAVPLLLLALGVYFIRLVGYSLIEDPWWCVPYELLEAFTLHLMWVACVSLAYKRSPPGMIATMQAIIGGLNFAVGRGFGSLVGGSTLAFFGTRIAFRVVGSMALVTMVFYAISHYCFMSDLGEYKDTKVIDKRRRQSDKDLSSSYQDSEAA